VLLGKVARRIRDAEILHTEVDGMLERAKEATRAGRYTYVEYARWADDLVILVSTRLPRVLAQWTPVQPVVGDLLSGPKR
jgi:hypothetical protein